MSIGWLNDFSTMLLDAARSGNLSEVKQLIAAGENPHVPDEYGRTAVMLASAYGNTETVRYLVEEIGVDADAPNRFGWTPLAYAAFYGYEDIVRCLVEKGHVNVNGKDDEGWTPLICAATNGHEDIVSYLLYSAKADVDEKDADGHDALMHAYGCGMEKTIAVLEKYIDERALYSFLLGDVRPTSRSTLFAHRLFDRNVMGVIHSFLVAVAVDA